MFISNDIEENLARDYLRGADGFLLAADKILNSTDMESEDWVFKLESPVSFLICHSAELILKAGLVKYDGFEQVKFSHDLLLLIERSNKNNILLNEKFSSYAVSANYNFLNHDYRYQRSFSGFPDGEHDRLIRLMKENPLEGNKEFRKYGLVLRHGVDLISFLEASREQLIIATQSIEKDK